MPSLRAFRAIRYDPRAVEDVGSVLCPPYDVIAPAEREALVARHPNNAVRLELPVDEDAMTGGRESGPSRYDIAGRLFREWHVSGVLRRDPAPGIYVYEQTYRVGAEERRARGFLCQLRLEDLEDGGPVRRHERTLGAPKEDRYRLLGAVGANLSPVMLIYDPGDGGRRSGELLDGLTRGAPTVDAVVGGGARHRLWLAEPAHESAAGQLLRAAAECPLTIADGHHRYETALRFRDTIRARQAATGDAHEHVLALLLDARSGGLTVLPTHRLLKSAVPAEKLLTLAVERLAAEARPDTTQLAREVTAAGRPAIWTSAGGTLLAARPGSLAVDLLDDALRELVGASAAELAARGELEYTTHTMYGMTEVAEGRAQALFLLPPTPIDAVLEAAARGEVMPQKSTYFVPKAATGLVFSSVVE